MLRETWEIQPCRMSYLPAVLSNSANRDQPWLRDHRNSESTMPHTEILLAFLLQGLVYNHAKKAILA